VLKEIVDPLGACFDLRSIPSADPTLSALELWGAEYQENCALLLRPQSLPTMRVLADRERCPLAVVGRVTGDGQVRLRDDRDGTIPLDLPLSRVLGSMPRRDFHCQVT